MSLAKTIDQLKIAGLSEGQNFNKYRSSSVDQMDAGRRPLRTIHYTEKFRNSENQNNISIMY